MGVTWNDLQEGAAAPRREIGPLTRTDFVRYQGASGDFNPIPLDDEFARSVGLPGRILHGLYTMALVARALCTVKLFLLLMIHFLPGLRGPPPGAGSFHPFLLADARLA